MSVCWPIRLLYVAWLGSQEDAEDALDEVAESFGIQNFSWRLHRALTQEGEEDAKRRIPRLWACEAWEGVHPYSWACPVPLGSGVGWGCGKDIGWGCEGCTALRNA